MSGKRMSSGERREEILQIALEIIYQQGFYNLTIRNIADKIGLSEAAIYRHYQNKEEIVNKLTDLIFNREEIWQLPEGDFDVLRKLEGIMKNQFEYFQQNPYLTAITFQEEIFREYPMIREKFNNCRKLREASLVKIILYGQGNGQLEDRVDPKSFAVIFLGTVRMSVLRWKNSAFKYNLKNEVKKLSHELFKIIKKEGWT